MPTIVESAKALSRELGRPAWLTSVAIGSQHGQEVIVLYVRASAKVLEKRFAGGWQGFPVVLRRRLRGARPLRGGWLRGEEFFLH